MDQNQFFRQAVIRICGSLEIEKAMQSCMEYLAGFIPVTKMEITFFDRSMGVLKTFASVPSPGGPGSYPSIAMPPDAVELIEAEYNAKSPKIKIANHPEKDPILRARLKLGQDANLSLLVMILDIDGEPLGALNLIYPARDTYTQKHAELIALLREPFNIALSNAIRFREIKDLQELLDNENEELKGELRLASVDEIIGADTGLQTVMAMVRQVAPLDSPVMIMGETGVGKEVIANAIHCSSPRAKGPFIKVNCGAIPDGLLDSELFGHQKGAFTGAVRQKRGRFERAHMGTIFLDEIGELPPNAQIRLLRVIQHKEIERVGGSDPIPVDVRIIAATHRNLELMINHGEFREDLWFRLNVFPIMIPPLRKRRDDIPTLLHYFLRKKSKELKMHTLPPIYPATLNRLVEYSWPGNVRELENLVERGLILSRGNSQNSQLNFGDFDHSAQISGATDDPLINDGIAPLNQAMVRHIKKALKACKGKIYGPDGAARLLDINPNTLRSRMRKFGIKSR
jgi:transcriptional regulator with GAF, ATPase, and Fis domain